MIILILATLIALLVAAKFMYDYVSYNIEEFVRCANRPFWWFTKTTTNISEAMNAASGAVSRFSKLLITHKYRESVYLTVLGTATVGYVDIVSAYVCGDDNECGGDNND